MKKEYVFAFGDTHFSANLPQENVINDIKGQVVNEILDVPAAVKAALQQPIGSPLLCDIVNPGDTVTIVVSDITRRWIRHDLFLPVILDELNQAGIPDSDISLTVALGSHRRLTQTEMTECYGDKSLKRVSGIHQSYGPDSEDFVYVGTTSHGTKTYINPHVAKADKVILTGGIVYHIMAGFGGGRKSVLPGISSYDTIQANHRFCLHPKEGQGINPACDSGKLTGNTMHEDAMEIAAMVKPDFILNVVLSPTGGFARFVAGAWDAAWLAGCHTVKEIFGVPIKEKTDVVIASAGGFPKDINLYQGVKTICNACEAAKKGGVVILLLECRDIKEPLEFISWFDYPSLYEHEMALRKDFTVPGFIALKVGYLAKKFKLIIVTLPENKAFIEKTGMIAATSLDEALKLAQHTLPNQNHTISVMTYGANTVPLCE